MFKNAEVLDSKRHAKLSYRPVTDYSFASGLTAAPLAASEVVPASRDYPIVFSSDENVVPMALLSLSKEGNSLVAEDGSWKGGYIPAHIRRYPFVLGETKEEGRYLVMIDRDAPQFGGGDGAEPLFDDGKPKPEGIIERARTFLESFQRELKQTQQMLKPLADSGILVARSVTINRDGQQSVAVSGFKAVDPEALAKLDDATVGTWLRSGLLGQVFAHLHSLQSLNRLAQQSSAGSVAAAKEQGEPVKH